MMITLTVEKEDSHLTGTRLDVRLLQEFRFVGERFDQNL